MHRAHAIYRQQESSEQELLTRYGPLIDTLARRMAHHVGNLSLLDDLWSAGAMGLLDAAQRFDATLGNRFETFAQHRIRGSMVDELRRQDHLPRRLRAEAARAFRVRGELTQALGHVPSEDEVATKLGIGVGELCELDAIAVPPSALLPDIVKSLVTQSPEDQVVQIETARELTNAVAALPERLQILLSLHYVEGLTYREIAEVLKVSQPRVSQLHSEAVAKLRHALAGEA